MVKFSKTGTKFSKTWLNLELIAVKRPCKPQYLYITSPGPKTAVCSHTPRFSYEVSKLAVSRTSAAPAPVLVGRVQRVYGHWGMGLGWVYRVGNTGTSHLARCSGRGVHPSGAGPGSPARGWSGWGCTARALPVQTTLRARSVHPVALPV